MVFGLLGYLSSGWFDGGRHKISSENRNSPRAFEESWLHRVPEFDDQEIAGICAECEKKGQTLASNRTALLDIVASIDLTTLAGDDTPDRVNTLVDRCVNPLGPETWDALTTSHGVVQRVHCGAVCVYPARVADAAKRLVNHHKAEHIGLASVAGGFPSGQYRLESRLLEIRLAIEDGATEIDTVINRCAALQDQWKVVYNEISEMRSACSNLAHLKTILATGELKTTERIYAASMAAMMAGSDFIKTSTGKESVNATLPVSLVMCFAIRDFYEKTGIRVGFKPAGGIRTAAEALAYRCLVETICGVEWLSPSLFRIGASSLLDDVEKALAVL